MLMTLMLPRPLKKRSALQVPPVGRRRGLLSELGEAGEPGIIQRVLFK